MMINTGMLSSNSDEWETPKDLFAELNTKYKFGLDACATIKNALCAAHFTVKENALQQDWSGYGNVFMNPPYGRVIKDFVLKAYEESKKGITVVCLLPARTETAWFHDYCLPFGEIKFLRGRLRFSGSKVNAPFPSMIVVFGANDKLPLDSR